MRNLLCSILLLCSASAFGQSSNGDQIVIGYQGKPVIRIVGTDTTIIDQEAVNRMLVAKVMADVPVQDPGKPYKPEEWKGMYFADSKSKLLYDHSRSKGK